MVASIPIHAKFCTYSRASSRCHSLRKLNRLTDGVQHHVVHENASNRALHGIRFRRFTPAQLHTCCSTYTLCTQRCVSKGTITSAAENIAASVCRNSSLKRPLSLTPDKRMYLYVQRLCSGNAVSELNAIALLSSNQAILPATKATKQCTYTTH